MIRVSDEVQKFANNVHYTTPARVYGTDEYARFVTRASHKSVPPTLTVVADEDWRMRLREAIAGHYMASINHDGSITLPFAKIDFGDMHDLTGLAVDIVTGQRIGPAQDMSVVYDVTSSGARLGSLPWNDTPDATVENLKAAVEKKWPGKGPYTVTGGFDPPVTWGSVAPTTTSPPATTYTLHPVILNGRDTGKKGSDASSAEAKKSVEGSIGAIVGDDITVGPVSWRVGNVRRIGVKWDGQSGSASVVYAPLDCKDTAAFVRSLFPSVTGRMCYSDVANGMWLSIPPATRTYTIRGYGEATDRTVEVASTNGDFKNLYTRALAKLTANGWASQDAVLRRLVIEQIDGVRNTDRAILFSNGVLS